MCIISGTPYISKGVGRMWFEIFILDLGATMNSAKFLYKHFMNVAEGN